MDVVDSHFSLPTFASAVECLRSKFENRVAKMVVRNDCTNLSDRVRSLFSEKYSYTDIDKRGRLDRHSSILHNIILTQAARAVWPMPRGLIDPLGLNEHDRKSVFPPPLRDEKLRIESER